MPLALDGHVHLQHAMPFEQIARNFAEAAPGHAPVCMIVESVGIDRYADLEERCESWGAMGLYDRETGLRFVAGRQVVSAEGLEILLLGSREQGFEGETADRVIAFGLEHGAAVCLPWGFGKWLGARRDLAARLHQRMPRHIMLGDIDNRPAVWSERLLKHTRVLRGSDNLPMTGSSDRVGLFGSTIADPRAWDRAEDLIDALRNASIDLRPFGKRKGLVASVTEQVRLRLPGKGR